MRDAFLRWFVRRGELIGGKGIIAFHQTGGKKSKTGLYAARSV